MNINSLTSDPVKERDGVWIEYPNGDGAKFLIGSPHTPRFRKAMQKNMAASRTTSAKLTDDQIAQINRAAYSEAIVLGWEGLTKDAAPFEYSPDNAKWLLENSTTIRLWVEQEAMNNANFRVEQLEEAKAKLGEGSVGE